MSTKKMIIGFLVCLLIPLFAAQTLSQTLTNESSRDVVDPDSWTQQWQRISEQRKQQFQIQNEKRIEQLQKRSRIESEKRSSESMRQVLRANQRQWRSIKPRLEKVQHLLKETRVCIYPGYYRRSRGSGGGSNNQQSHAKVEEGWKWNKAWEKKAPTELTKGERTCEELLLLLEDKNSNQEEIEQKVEALREIRKDASMQLGRAQQELREVLTFRQKATLTLMRYLD
jgi:Spy/CpxP family protein refolding chaperone